MRIHLFTVLSFMLVTTLMSSAQESKASAPVLPGSQYSGMYSFLRDGEYLQITVEEKGHVSGFISRYEDLDSHRDIKFLTHFFKQGQIEGSKLSFTTETVHGEWFEFQGTIERGEGKQAGDEAFYVLKGKLVHYSTDAEKKVTSRSREVALKSFPHDLTSRPTEKKD